MTVLPSSSICIAGKGSFINPWAGIFFSRQYIVLYSGVDLSKPCDPASYGNPMFYAVSMKKYRVVEMLDRIGYSVADPCNSFDEVPMVHAKRLGDPIMIKVIEDCLARKKEVTNQVAS